MAKTGQVVKTFPYAADGVRIETLQAGRILSFPDAIFEGLKNGGYVEPSDGEPENAVSEAAARDPILDEAATRLSGASDEELKEIIARSGTPVSGNLVHAELMAAAQRQLVREQHGRAPVLGVDPNSGVTEHPLAAPGAPTPPSAAAAVANAIAGGDGAPVDPAGGEPAVAASGVGGGETATDGSHSSGNGGVLTNQFGEPELARRDATTTEGVSATPEGASAGDDDGLAASAADGDGETGADDPSSDADAPTNQFGEPQPARRKRSPRA